MINVTVLYKNGTEIAHKFGDAEKARMFTLACKARVDVQRVKVIDYERK